MNNIKNKISENKILTFIIVAFVLALSLYGCKTLIANAANNQEEKSTENQEQVDVNNEQVSDDELTAYAYRDADTLAFTCSGMVARLHDEWYYVPTSANEASDWPWDSKRGEYTDIRFDTSFMCYKGITSTSYMFYNFVNCRGTEGFENFNTSNVKEMKYMFRNFGYYFSWLDSAPNVSTWDTSQVTDMYGMFWGYGYLSKDLNNVPDTSKWNVSKVETLESMFQDYGYSSTVLNVVPDVSNWNVAKVDTMQSMFRNYGYNSLVLDKTVNVTNWSPTEVDDVSHMFQDYSHSTTKLKDVPNFSKWPHKHCEEVQYMLCGYAHLCIFENLDLSSFNMYRDDWYIFTHQKNMLLNCHLRSITLGSKWTHVSMSASYCCVTNSKDQVDAIWYDNDGKAYPGASIGTQFRTVATTYYDTPLEAYAYKDTTDQGETIFGLAYDNKKDWHEASYNLSTYGTSEASWEWDSERNSFTKVKIDESFKNYKGLNSTAFMFSNFANVNSQEGFENIDTSNVTNMEAMFWMYGYKSTALNTVPDVLNWNTSNVKVMNHMFWNYGSQSTFECLNLSNWSIHDTEESSGMLEGMKLKSIVLGHHFVTDLSASNGKLTNSKGEKSASWYDSNGRECPECCMGLSIKDQTTTYYDTNPSLVEAYGYRDGNTLVLTYDRDKSVHESQSQTVYSIPTNATEAKSWSWSRDRYDLTKIKINPNFRDYDKLTSTAYMFSYFNNVTENEGFQYLDTSNVTNMSNMFSWYARSLEDTNIMPDVANWDTSKVEDMSGMFYDYAYDSKTLCDTPCVLNWNTSNVKDMSDMFYEYGYSSKKLYSAPDISNWNTSNVETMFSMFYKYTFNSFLPSLDLSNLDTTKVKNCNFMLDGVKVRSIKLGPKFNLDLTSDAGRLNNTLLKMDATWYDNDGKAYPGASIGTQPRTVATDYLEVYPEKSNVALHSNNVINQQHAIDNAISQHSQNSSLIHHITHHVSKVADVIKKVFH